MSAHVILFDSENDLLAACIKQPRSFSRLSEAKKLRMCDGGDLAVFSKPVAWRAWPGAGKISGGSRVHHEIGRYRHFLCLKLRWFGGNHNWLVVWNIWIHLDYMFPSNYIGNVIIPTDELQHFSEGWRKTIINHH